MDESGTPANPGDIGRRVAHRREELGLTRAQLADEAGMAPGYVSHLEEQPAEVSQSALFRLAKALGVSVGFLLGEGVDLPSGRGRAGSHPVLEALDGAACRRLLEPGGVGRVVLVEPRGPAALPVNFALLDGDVVFRTASGSPVAAADGREVGFEVDRIDDAMSEGWSVLVTGRARRITDPEEMARARSLGMEPWAGGERDLYLRLSADEVSGRRIRVQP